MSGEARRGTVAGDPVYKLSGKINDFQDKQKIGCVYILLICKFISCIP